MGHGHGDLKRRDWKDDKHEKNPMVGDEHEKNSIEY